MATTVDLTHPIVACAETVSAALGEVAQVEPVYMSVQDKATALEELARAEARLVELRLRVMATAEDVAAQDGARDVAAWLAHRTRAEPRALRADLELARDLDRTYARVAEGMRAGRVSAAQARVITAAVEDLPTGVDAEIKTRAEQTLVGYAADFRPGQLRRLGRRILDVVAPEVADAEDARLLARACHMVCVRGVADETGVTECRAGEECRNDIADNLVLAGALGGPLVAAGAGGRDGPGAGFG